jgi:hypothetical protein
MFSTPRYNRDIDVNAFGRKLIDMCCLHSLHMLNGRFSNDRNGNFTCTANNGHS